MLRPVALVLIAALLCSGPATAVVRTGGPGDDKLTGTGKADKLNGRGGDDRLFGQGGRDQVNGGPGDDTVKGGGGADDIGGGAGNDRVDAGSDHRIDFAYGGPGDDVVFVRGLDTAYAGKGDDKIVVSYPGVTMTVDCGPGTDSVEFNQPPPATVSVGDCEHVSVVPAG